MNSAIEPGTDSIVVEEVFLHPCEVIWRALTSSALMGRWMMLPTGFEPVVGNRFSFQTKAAGQWDGTIRCQVLKVVEKETLSYAWSGGHEANQGYGSKLDTVVTITLSEVEGGTRVRLVHSGFELPKNDAAYRNMSEGWKVVVKRLEATAAEEASSAMQH